MSKYIKWLLPLMMLWLYGCGPIVIHHADGRVEAYENFSDLVQKKKKAREDAAFVKSVKEKEKVFYQNVTSVHQVPAWIEQKTAAGEQQDILYLYKSILKLNDFGENAANDFLHSPEYQVILYARHFVKGNQFLQVVDKPPTIDIDYDNNTYKMEVELGGIRRITVFKGNASCKKTGKVTHDTKEAGFLESLFTLGAVVSKNYEHIESFCTMKHDDLQKMAAIERALSLEYYQSQNIAYDGSLKASKEYVQNKGYYSYYHKVVSENYRNSSYDGLPLPPQIKVNSNLVESIKPSYRNEYMDGYRLSCRATEVDMLIISNWVNFDTNITVNRQTGVANIKEGDFDQSSNNIPELAVDYCSHMIFKYQKR